MIPKAKRVPQVPTVPSSTLGLLLTRLPIRVPQVPTVSSSTLGLLLALLLLTAAPAHPQGCSQCRETVGQTPGRTRTAYRHAIVAMTVAAGTVFFASVFVLKRFR